jgi:hypothetical protein
VRTLVVTHARPFVGPSAPAPITFVMVENHAVASLLGSQAIVTTRYEIDKSAVTQILKLLAYLRFDVLVAGIKIAEMAFERVDLVKGELALAERLDAIHDVEQPSARVRRFIPEEKRFPPFGEDRFLRANDTTLNDVNFARFGNTVEQNFRADPSGATRRHRQRLALLDDLADEEMFWHNEQVGGWRRRKIVPRRTVDSCGGKFAFQHLSGKMMQLATAYRMMFLEKVD